MSVPLEIPFAVDRRRVGDRTVVAVSGELDIATVPQLRAAIDAEPGSLMIDLSATTFIDSSGLHVLFHTCEARDGAVAIICPSGQVRRVIEIAGMAAALPLYDDVAAALQSA